MIRRSAILASALFVTLSAGRARAENPWNELMGPEKPQLWTDPKGRFYFDLPVGWTAQLRKDAEHLVDVWKTHPDNGFVAHVVFELRAVPPETKVGHFATRVLEESRSSAPGFRLLEEDGIQVASRPARRAYFTYQERNNAALKNEVVQVVLIVGERAFVVTLETAFGARAVFWEDFEKMLRGFQGRAPGEESMAMPKDRKKIRAGEMVNPEAIKY